MSIAPRLPSHVEVAGLLRRVAAAGGFGAVLKKGEADAGAILLILRNSRMIPTLFERVSQLDGTRPWTQNRTQDIDNPGNFDDYLHRRQSSDPDLWIIELDIANPERFILESG